MPSRAATREDSTSVGELETKTLGVEPLPILVGYEGKEHGFFNFNRDGGADYEDTVKRMIGFFQSLGWIKG